MKRWLVEADGGSRGNPGPAGYGALVREDGGDLLAEVAESIGKQTNNVAEYRGLLAGLQAAADVCGQAGYCGDVQLEVRVDSKLVVEQMRGRWKVKHPELRALARQAARLTERFAGVSYQWVPRERNTHADRLANEAMDAAARGEPWSRRTGSTPGSAAASSAASSAMPTATSQDASVPVSAVPTTGWMAPRRAPTAAVLLRHGETALSRERRFSGPSPAELTTAGQAQARAAAELLRALGDIEAIVSSPFTRARQTADLVAGELGVAVRDDADLRETDFGVWEGLTFDEVQKRWPDELRAWLADPTVAPPGGESFAETADRVGRARDAILERYPERTVLVVSHVTPIKTLLREALLAPPAALYRIHLDVACLCEIHWYADGYAVVRSLNDTRHLAPPR